MSCGIAQPVPYIVSSDGWVDGDGGVGRENEAT